MVFVDKGLNFMRKERDGNKMVSVNFSINIDFVFALFIFVATQNHHVHRIVNTYSICSSSFENLQALNPIMECLGKYFTIVITSISHLKLIHIRFTHI